MLQFFAAVVWHANSLALVEGQCSCLSSLAPFGITTTTNGSLSVLTSAGLLNYPATYGLGRCAAHDSGLPPVCNTLNPPGWCHHQWCYVNASVCGGVATLVPSAYLAHHPRGTEIKLSYSFCSSDDLWSEFNSVFAGTVKFCSVLKEINGVPCGNTASFLQVKAMVETINGLTGGLGFDVLARNPANPSYYRAEYTYQTFPDGAWETVGRSRAENLFPQCDVIVGQGHGCGATGDDEIQAQAAIADAHQRLYFTQRGPRRVLSNPADPASRLSRYMFSTHIRSDLYAHGMLRYIAQTVTSTKTGPLRLAILNFGHNAFFDGVADGALQYAVADERYDIATVAHAKKWSSTLGPVCEPYGASSGAAGCSSLARHMDALIASVPDVVLVSGNGEAFKHVLQHLSEARPKVNKGNVEKDTKMISALFWVGVPWLKNGRPACAGLRGHCAYASGATQISPEEADTYQDQLLVSAGLPATYKWLRENHTELAAAYIKNVTKAEADAAVIPSIVVQAMQKVFQYRAPANKSFPLRFPGSADYEALRDYIGSGQTIARTYYGKVAFDEFGSNAGRDASIFQSQEDGKVVTTFPASLEGSRPYTHPVPAMALAPVGKEAYHLDYGPSCDSTAAILPACGTSEGGPTCALCGPLAYDESFPLPTTWLALGGSLLFICFVATSMFFVHHRISKQKKQHQKAKIYLKQLITKLGDIVSAPKLLSETKAQEDDGTKAEVKATRLQQTYEQIEILLKGTIDERGAVDIANDLGCKLDDNTAKTLRYKLDDSETTGWDYMISYTHSDEAATTIAADLCASLTSKKWNVWLDVKMNENDMLNAAFMERAAKTSGCVIAIITPKYFTRPMCVRELRAAKSANTPIQPVLLPAHKDRVGEFLTTAPQDLQSLGDEVEWLTLDRSHLAYWKTGVDVLITRTQGPDLRKATKSTATKALRNAGSNELLLKLALGNPTLDPAVRASIEAELQESGVAEGLPPEPQLEPQYHV
eukprot:COSAG01_NODE_6670_length_3554_cov_2.322431_2_plen_992_part_00